MSVRAHRIVNVEYAPEPSFNLYYNEKLIEFLESENECGFWGQMNDSGTGQVSITAEALKKALNRAKSLELEADDVKAIEGDIAFAEAQGKDYITYDCF